MIPVGTIPRPGLEAAALEQILGDPADPAGLFGWAAALRAEAAEDPRDDAAAVLAEAGLRQAMIPQAWGGAGTLTGMDGLLALARRLTARDPSLMPRCMFSIGPLCVLDMAGSPEQRARISDRVLAGEDIAFALSEPESRSDIMQGGLTCAGGVLEGRKWLIGRAAAASGFLVLARTGPGGPVGWSLVLTGRDGSVTAGPRARLSGMCGIDVADLGFAHTPVQETVGPEGMGIELTFRAQGPVKALSVAAALGPTETALRLAGSVPGLHDHGRLLLAEAFADHMVLDALAIGTMRVLSAAPRQFSIWASVTKACGIDLPPAVFRRCATVLGARSVLRDDPAGGIFGKMCRDAGIVRVIDINEVVNLRAIATQLDAVNARRREADPQARWDEMRGVLDLSAPAGPARLDRTQVTTMGGERLTESLPAIRAALADDPRLEGIVRETVLEALDALGAELDTLAEDLAALRGRYGAGYAARPELIRAATRFVRVHAGAAVAGLFAANPGGAPCFGAGGWLALALFRLAFGERRDPPAPVWEAAWNLLHHHHAEGLAPSAEPVACR